MLKRAALLSICRVVVLLAIGSAPAAAQSINTYAGGGSEDGQPAAAVALAAPQGVAVAANGDVYIVERNAGRVRRVDHSTGRIYTVAGNGSSGFTGDGGAATEATLKEPRGIAFDSEQNLYITDAGNGRIRRVDAKTGIITTFAGTGPGDSLQGDGGPAKNAALNGPFGITIRGRFLYFTEFGYLGNHVRRISLDSGVIDTLAGARDGSTGFSGDGGAAKDAKLDTPLGIITASDGSIYFADAGNGRVRKIDANGTITTVAGGGNDTADGVPATQAKLEFPTMVTFDRNGNLVVTADSRVALIDRQTQAVSTITRETTRSYGLTTDADGNFVLENELDSTVVRLTPSNAMSLVAGAGNFVGDGRRATAAVLHRPVGLAVDASGNLFIADSASTIVRRVDAVTGVITTYAGKPGFFYVDNQEGADRTDSVVGGVQDLAFDSAGNLYTSDPHNNRIWRISRDGKITTYAGGGFPSDELGDGGPATAASIRPLGIAFDSKDNLYLTDRSRIRRVDAATKIITTVAGNGKDGFSGDGGQAAAASLDGPMDVAIDASGVLYISDSNNSAIRKVGADGVISTFAGRGSPNDGIGDGGPAAAAAMSPGLLAIDRTRGVLLVADRAFHRIRSIDLQSTTITTVAGSATFYTDGDFTGDNGRATAARLNLGFSPGGVALNANGDLFISDTENNRVRRVNTCTSVTAPTLVSPANGSINISTAPTLKWNSVPGAFRYDVSLDTADGATQVIATDVSETSFTASNLQPGRKYSWRVTAKGDPFCSPESKATSTIASFTTSGVCTASAPTLAAPADGASLPAGGAVDLSWQASGASSYDVYLGGSNPPALFASNVTSTSLRVNANGTNYWFVVAHAACDATQTAASPVRSFTVAASNAGCVQSVALSQPGNGAADVPLTVELSWSVSPAASSDLYFGTTPEPPLLTSALSRTTQTVTGLEPGTTYYWRVIARGSCPVATASSPVFSFTTRGCTPPLAPAIAFAPASVTVGTTYAIVWSAPAGADSDAVYIVERSRSAGFESLVDSQITSSVAATFVATSTGDLYHRVRAVPSCNPAAAGPNSDVRKVSVVAGKPNVVFTSTPASVVTSIGERLETRRSSFTLENIGASSVQLLIGRQELAGSQPFFSIFDPQGGDSAFVTLEPRKPRTFEVRFSGPPNNVEGAYQGVIFAAAAGEGLAVTPYAFVNLRVGGGASDSPELLVDGVPSSYVAFPGWSGDDANRPARVIEVRNPGSTPMSVAAEIGPEVWLALDPTWNSTPIPPGASRSISLTTRRARAANGSALPRYTWLTIRTRDGLSSRMLVQDNDAVASASGRTARLDPSDRTFIVPYAVSRADDAKNPVVSRVWLSNVGSESVQAEVVFTPTGQDGFSGGGVRRATIVLPPNDVVTLTDPLTQLFGATRPASGQLEVRIPRERLGLVSVRSTIAALTSGSEISLPIVNRGDGARLSDPQQIDGIVPFTGSTTSVLLAETTGNDAARVRISAFGASGARSGEASVDVPRYGAVTIANLAATLGLNSLDSTRFEIRVESGGGAVAAVGLAADATGARGAAALALPLATTGASSIDLRRRSDAVTAPPSTSLVVPVIGSPSGAIPQRTTVGFVAPPFGSVTFKALLRNAAGVTVGEQKQVILGSGASRVFSDIAAELFGASAAEGSVFVDAPSGGKVYAVLQGSASSASAPTTFMQLPSTLSEALTSAANAQQRPLFFEGVEQSLDGSGKRWGLLLNEIAGNSGSVDIRMFEPGNRTAPIAIAQQTISPYQQLRLDSVFAALGLDSAERRKDRTNVLLVVTATGGGAKVAASAMSVDSSGAVRTYPLAPSIGSATPSVSLTTPVSAPPPAPTRRRSVRK